MKLLFLFVIVGVVNSFKVNSYHRLESQKDESESIYSKAKSAYDVIPKTLQEDAVLSVPNLIQKYGYPCEIHQVVTEDGYVLDMHRIPNVKGDTRIGKRPAVYLQHGMAGSSADWVIQGSKKAFAYILVEAGFDVWLGNARDNLYGRKNLVRNPKNEPKEFWDFTFHEIAVFDLPAMTDYVISKTGQEKIFFIGHSQGTLESYIFLAERPEYNYKFHSVFSFAPLSFMTNTKNAFLQTGAIYYKELYILEKILKVYEISPTNLFGKQFVQIFCNDNSPFQHVCIQMLGTTFGSNPQGINASIIPIFAGHYPAGFSTKSSFHLLQLVNSDKFRQFDYGIIENINRYGEILPPNYNFTNINVDVHLYYSSNDLISSDIDVLQLFGKLPRPFKYFMDGYNHMDYQYSLNAPEKLFTPVIEKMREYLNDQSTLQSTLKKLLIKLN